MAALEIGIAGAGLLGRLLAWKLARRGHSVTVFDPASGPTDHGHAAGWTAAGMLSPIAELESADTQVAELGQRSLDLWQTIVGELQQPVHFRREGSLLLAHRQDLGAAQRMLDVLRSKLEPARMPRPLPADELAALEPGVHGPTHAWLLVGEGQIHTVQAMQALADGATRAGALWHWDREARVLAPGLIDGQRFHHVFDVRGVGARPELPPSQSADGVDHGFTPQVRGVRGELVWLHAPGVTLHRPLRLLHPRWRVYLVPRPGELVVVGASEIESEDRSPISLLTLVGLLNAAQSVLPELAEARVVHTETNLRPALPDNQPHVSWEPGLTRINGLFRHGWLIAPALVQDALQQAGLEPFSGATMAALARAAAKVAVLPRGADR